MKIVSINATEILFNNGKKLTSEHDQDCCELVFADFENMQVMGEREKNYVNADELDFFENILDSVVPIEDLGFYLVTKQGICLLVSCYNVQNGYYSDELVLRYGDKCKDISKYTKSEYNGGVNVGGEYLEEKVSRSNKTQGITFRKYEEGWATWSRDEQPSDYPSEVQKRGIEESELNPCPFCGGKAEFREMMGVECEYITIQCMKCGMCCTKYESWGAVSMVEDWNRRVKG